MNRGVIGLTILLAACSTASQPTAIQSPAALSSSSEPRPSSAPSSTPTPSPTTSATKGSLAPDDFVPVKRLKAFPTWSGTDLQGNPWSSTSLLGRVTVVNFWASWCGPCRNEWPILRDATADFPAVKFVGINTQDSITDAKSWLAENPTTYDHIYDDRAVIKASLTTVPNMGMPITVILNSKGEITHWFVGEISAAGLRRVLS